MNTIFALTAKVITETAPIDPYSKYRLLLCLMGIGFFLFIFIGIWQALTLGGNN